MKTSCVRTTLLPLFLFLNTVCVTALEKDSHCRDNHPIIRKVAIRGNVSVTCPGLTGQEMKFTICKGLTEITSYTYLSDKNTTEDPNHLGGDFHLNPEDNTTSLVLYDVTFKHQGLYTCVAEKTFPPPHVEIKEKPQTIVIVEELESEQNVQRCDLLLWAALVALILYGLIVTVVALSLRARLKIADAATHDYMNMKPQARRKNQGILQPTRMSWYSDTTTSITSCSKLSYKRTPT